MSHRYYTTPPFTVLVAHPRRKAFRNQIVRDNSGQAQVSLLTGDPTASSGSITVLDAGFLVTALPARGGLTLTPPLTVGVVVTINGNTLTGVAGARTPGANNFQVTASDVAAEIVAAINDAANAFKTDVVACRTGNFVGLTAVTAGAAGNSLTLATSDPTEVSLSGDTLLGGGQSAGQSVFRLGPYTLVTGLHWSPVVGNINSSATALAAAINRLQCYSATAAGPVVNIVGPPGVQDAEGLVFSVSYDGVVENFAVSPTNGFLGGGAPNMGPPEIL